MQDTGLNPTWRIGKDRHFLAFAERPRSVADIDLDGPKAVADQLSEKLQIKIEAIALKSYITDAISAEDLVHRKWVACILAKDGIEEPGEEQMTDIHHVGDAALPAKFANFPTAIAGWVARTENEAGLKPRNRGEQLFIIGKIVLKVGVLDDDDVAGGNLEPLANRVALSGGFVLQQNLYTRMFAIAQHIGAGAIGRIAFDQADFHLVTGDDLASNASITATKVFFSLYTGITTDNRNGRSVGGASRPRRAMAISCSAAGSSDRPRPECFADLRRVHWPAADD